MLAQDIKSEKEKSRILYMYNYNVNKITLASRVKPPVSYSSAMSSNSNGKLL